MAKYLVELSLLTRSTALVVVESDHRPDRSDMGEIYDLYETDDWHEDASFADEGEHALLGEIIDGQFAGVKNVAALPVLKLEDD
jgi:hypothetical protein